MEIIKQKKASKRKLVKNLEIKMNRALIGIVLDHELTAQQEKTLRQLLKGMAVLNVEVVVLADSNLDVITGKNVRLLPYNRKNRQLILEAADMALTFSFNDVEEMLIHGTVPISAKRPEISDYDPNHETGNGFIYKRSNSWAIFEAMVRAIETFKFPYDWKHIVRQAAK